MTKVNLLNKRTAGIIVGVAIATAALSIQASAGVDIYNEDLVAYKISITSENSSKSREVGPGESWRSVCEECNISIASMGETKWVEETTASGEDVVSINYGRVGFGGC